MRENSVEVLVTEALQKFSTWSASAIANQMLGANPVSVAFGIAKGNGPNDRKLAIRARSIDMFSLPPVLEIIKNAKEVDVRATGIIRGPRRAINLAKTLEDTMRNRVRPLVSGHSIGHHKITAGTLGCFVEHKKGIFILSNNHVLANSNDASKGDAILQPGRYDDGKNPDDVVGELFGFKVIVGDGNLMDAAIASIKKEYVPTDFKTPHIGKLTSTVVAPKDILGKKVQKTGRTTGHTLGEVTAVNVRGVAVNYGNGNVYRFDNCIEVVGENGDFSRGGDSGSLVVDMDNNPFGLLFAGSAEHTILCELGPVLKEFGCKVAV